jgi:hypothetical protein
MPTDKSPRTLPRSASRSASKAKSGLGENSFKTAVVLTSTAVEALFAWVSKATCRSNSDSRLKPITLQRPLSLLISSASSRSVWQKVLIIFASNSAFFRLLRRSCGVLRKKRSSIRLPRSATISLFVPCLLMPLLLDSISTRMYEEPWLLGASRNWRLR